MRSEITWRKYRQSDIYYHDLDAVVGLHGETEEALQMKMDLPNMISEPVLEAWVGERGGEVGGAIYLEAVVEPVMVGRDPAFSASARRLAPMLFGRMAARGFRTVRMVVPSWIGDEAKAINKELSATGFISTDKAYYHHRYDLRPAVAGGNGRP